VANLPAFLPCAFTPGHELPHVAEIVPQRRGAQVLFFMEVLLELRKGQLSRLGKRGLTRPTHDGHLANTLADMPQ
jgi:hypothetical protein